MEYYNYPIINTILNSNFVAWFFAKGNYFEVKKEHEKYVHEYYEKYYNSQFDHEIILEIFTILYDTNLDNQSKIDKINLIIMEN